VKRFHRTREARTGRIKISLTSANKRLTIKVIRKPPRNPKTETTMGFDHVRDDASRDAANYASKYVEKAIRQMTDAQLADPAACTAKGEELRQHFADEAERRAVGEARRLGQALAGHR
jgi:hypothetical protein